MNTEFHRINCCIIHGCQHDKEYCPVINHEITQQTLCQKCLKLFSFLAPAVKVTTEELMLIKNNQTHYFFQSVEETQLLIGQSICLIDNSNHSYFCKVSFIQSFEDKYIISISR